MKQREGKSGTFNQRNDRGKARVESGRGGDGRHNVVDGTRTRDIPDSSVANDRASGVTTQANRKLRGYVMWVVINNDPKHKAYASAAGKGGWYSGRAGGWYLFGSYGLAFQWAKEVLGMNSLWFVCQQQGKVVTVAPF